MPMQEDRFAQQIKKGVMEMLVLKLLSQKPNYGYELLTRLSNVPGGTLGVKEGTLYPILYRLEEENLLESGWQTETGRAAPKKVYTITPAGLERLKHQKEIWQTFQSDVAFILNQEDDHEI